MDLLRALTINFAKLALEAVTHMQQANCIFVVPSGGVHDSVVAFNIFRLGFGCWADLVRQATTALAVVCSA